MGRYNPHGPVILGEEWVPIRNEDLVLDPFANTLERGYGFTLGSSTQVNNVRFYINEFPPLFVRNQAYTANIYPRGTEANSGPIRSVIIPCNNGTVTGAGISAFPVGTSVAAAMYDSSANSYLLWQIGNSIFNAVSFFFATNSYSQLLSGKRILGVDLITGVDVAVTATANPDDWAPTFTGWISPYLTNDAMFADPSAFNGGGFTSYRPLVTFQSTAGTRLLIRTRMGDVDMAYGATGSFTTSSPNISQWTYPELQRFEASATNRLFVILASSSFADLGAQVRINYMAMEVFYCEERRVAFGTNNILGLTGSAPQRPGFQLGMNQILVRNISGTTNPILTAGNYTVTLSEANTGDDFGVAFSPFETAKVNELRQLYEIPTHPGVQVNLPFPLNDDAIDTTFTRESTALIPQLSLHTSGGAVITESHPYGRQAVGQVWGNNFVTQDIDDSALSLSSFPVVRYYARRFGDTTVPLRISSTSPLVSGGGMSCQITPAEFDALEEILDGWKQVDCRFTTPAPMGGSSFPTWKWTATGEFAGSRWEVLGAAAYAASGIAQQMPINLQFGQVPTGQQLYDATYGAPTRGATINEEWLPQLGPYVSGAATDQAADVAVIFSQDMPAVTGFTVTVASQAISGIGQNCGIDPCGIPTRILYNQLAWGLPTNAGASASDDFNRVVVGGWGTASDGKVWQNTTGVDNSVNGSSGLIVASTGGDREGWVLLGGPDQNVSATVSIDSIPPTFRYRVGVLARLTDSSNHYNAEMWYQSSGIVELYIRKRVAGTSTDLATIQIQSLGLSTTARRIIRFEVVGTLLRAKVWAENLDEPSWWQLEVTDSSLTTGNNGGIYVRNDSTGSPIFSFDNFAAGPPSSNFGSYELQRSDDITAWATIMKATNVATIGFKDYEARVDMISNYRIRGVNVYDFAGPWSSTVSIGAISPGVSGSCLSQAHVMIFTTNERQDGFSNLAYSNAWESDVTESFDFPEAAFTQLQPMYNRDFFTAFRPTERGGEDFTRTVLVQAAAIAPETLADFTSLRNMAWEDVSYICVRDEDGNRWFANVNVPNGVVQNRRRLYMATVQIVEVTDTPTQVDP